MTSREHQMNRAAIQYVLAAALLASSIAWTACSSADGKTKDPQAPPPPVAVSAVAATEQPIARFIRATGTLMAEEQAGGAAETAGREHAVRSDHRAGGAEREGVVRARAERVPADPVAARPAGRVAIGVRAASN